MILLHGFPEFWYSWRYQIPVLAQHFHVVAPDMRGYNDSDKPEGVEQYQLSHLIEDVMGLIRFFDQKKAIIVGHDWGAIVAWAFATIHPEATERLISCNGPHPGLFQRLQGLSHAECWPVFQRLFYIFFFHVPDVGENEQVGIQDAAKATAEFVAAPFTLRLIPNCGHCVQQEEPELVNQYILEFLADLKR